LFGFYGNGYASWGDRIDQTRAYTNLVWLDIGDADLEAKLARVRLNGQTAIIAVSPWVFRLPSTEPAENASALLGWWAMLAPDLKAVVTAFLIADEPFRQNDNHVHAPPATVHANLNFTARWLRYNTGKLICVAGAGNEFDKFGVPTDVDWIGMYRYSYNTHWTQLVYSFLNLKRQKRPEQKIVAIMDAYANAEHPIDEKRIKAFNGWWQTLISWYSDDVVALCPFLYQTTTMEGRQVWGAESMPQVLLDLQSIKLKLVRPSSQ